MLSAAEKEMLFLYHSHFVCITLNNGECREGIVTAIGDDSIVADKDTLLLEDISDIEYVGFLTDFHTYNNFGEIDEVYTFEMADVVDEELIEMVKYHEYHCRVKCHLDLQDKICAKDVKIMASMHVLNQEVLSAGNFLYTMKDGSRRVGTLVKSESGYTLEYNGYPTCNFVQTQVVDITRIPVINDYVMVITHTGEVYQGLVSAVREDGFNVLENRSFRIISYAEIEQLRYFGELTSDYGMIDEKYKCKLPHYLHDAEDEARIKEPHAKLTYVVGVNDRGQIAKDVMVSDNARLMQSVKWYIGLVFFYKAVTGGYVGDRYVAPGCGDKKCKKVYFNAAQFPIAYESNKMYLVKYTVAKMKDEAGRRVVSRMQVLQQYERENIAGIQIDEAGNVTLEPMYRKALFQYKDRNVEVILQNEEKKTGILAAYEESGISLGVETDAGQSTERIAYADIRELRTSGEITQYDSNKGHGKVDSKYTLFIGDVPEMERSMLKTGAKVSFVIRTSEKAVTPWTECKAIKVIEAAKEESAEAAEEETSYKMEEVYVTAYANNVYTVIAKADYGKSDVRPYEIHTEKENPFKELDKYDYLAYFTKRYENDEETYIAVIDPEEAPIPKICYGYVTDLDENSASVTIVSKENYANNGKKSDCPLSSMKPEIRRQLSELELYDWWVKYKWSQSGVQVIAVVRKSQKKYYGYLSADNGEPSEERRKWFITPEYSDIKQRGVVPCFHRNLKCSSEEVKAQLRFKGMYIDIASINRANCKYKVCYTLDLERLQSLGKKVVKTAEIVEIQEHLFTKKAVTKEFRIDLEALAEELKLEKVPGVEYAYGILGAYPKKKPHYSIVDRFQKGVSVVSAETLATVISDSPDKVTLNECCETTNGKRCYAVRFVLGAVNGDGNREINYGHPIDFLKYFETKNIADEIKVEDNILSGKLNEIALEGSFNKPNKVTKTAPGYVKGESILYKTGADEYALADIESVSGSMLLLKGDQAIDAQQTEVYRFGVLTGLANDSDNDRNIEPKGYINNYLEFDIDEKMDKEDRKEFGQDYKSRLIIYTCNKDGIVTMVRQPSEEMVESLEWQKGTVTEYNDSSETVNRYVVIKDKAVEVKYYPTTYHKLKPKQMYELKGKDVYMKQILCPDWNGGQLGRWNAVAVTINADVEFLESPVFMQMVTNPNFSERDVAEYAYHLLKFQNVTWSKEHVAYLFLPDFYNVTEIGDIIRSGEKQDIKEIFKNRLSSDVSLNEFIPHLMALDYKSFIEVQKKVDFNTDDYPGLAERIREYCEDVCSSEIEAGDEENVWELLKTCRSRYLDICGNLKKEFESLRDKNICSRIVTIMKHMLPDEKYKAFCKLICEEDRKRINKLRRCCENAASKENNVLYSAQAEISDLCEQVKTKPSLLASELLSEAVLEQVRMEIKQLVKMHNDDRMQRPLIRCMLNEETVTGAEQAVITNEQKRLDIIVANGEAGTGKNYYAADYVKVQWSIEGAKGLKLSGAENALGSIASGGAVTFGITLAQWNEVLEEEELTFNWKVSYEYSENYDETTEVEGDWNETIISVIPAADKSDIENPYTDAADGDALETDDMFYGREEQKKDLRRLLIDDRNQLRPGKIAIVHGQKTCGKSSLVNQIQNELESDYSDRAIVISYPTILYESLETFRFDLAQQIVEDLLNKIYDDVKYDNLMEEIEAAKEAEKPIVLEVPAWNEKKWLMQLKTFFGKFNAIHKNKYKVVLVMDEFTALCVDIRESSVGGKNYRNLLDFFRTLSSLGIIQIIIGHASMISLIDELGKTNELAKTQNRVELYALEENEARELIREPMQSCLEYNPYDTYLGELAIKRLLYLSGGSPSVLMKLCDKMCQYYITEKQGLQLTVEDVNLVAERYICNPDNNTIYDMILYEHGDSKKLKAQIKTYLEYVAKNTDTGTGSCRIDDEECLEECKEEFESLKEIALLRELLETRRVLTSANGYVNIILGLYVEYIQSKMDKKE